jgi:hypothetical protein
MSRPRRRAAHVVASATALLAALALSGCSAGAVTQTDTTLTTVTGSSGQVGEMLVRDLSIDAGPTAVVPAGAAVTLRGTLVNEAALGDRLVSVSTPYAQSVTAEGVTQIPGDNAIMIVGSDPVPVGPPPLDTRVTGTARIVLSGATQVLHGGPTYPLTLTFERAGSVTLPVPVLSSGLAPVS